MTEHRRIRGIEIRATDTGGKPGVTLQAIVPNVVDDYGSVWMAHCFDASLEERLPVLCWAHDWSDPLGPGTGFTASDNGPSVDFDYSDFEAVPQARRADAQVRDGTIRDCSVGFSVPAGGRREPTEAEMAKWPGVREIIETAQLDEISLVLSGAVPGAKVLAYRAAGATATVSEDAVIDLAKKVEAGEMTRAEAAIALDLLAGADKETDDGPGDEELAAELDQIEADADEALDLL